MKLAALTLAGLLCATAAHAQLVRAGRSPVQARQAINGGFYAIAGLALTGDCAKTPPAGLTMMACYDFANGSYTNNGTTPQASFVASGGTLPAGCTITAGSGLMCSGTSVSSITTNNPSSGYFLTTLASIPSSTINQVNSELGNGSIITTGNLQSYSNSSGRVGSTVGSVANSITTSGSVQVASCYAGSATGYTSLAGAAGVSANDTGAPASSKLYVGNDSVGDSPNTQNYTASVRIFTGTCNATNVQAASAN